MGKTTADDNVGYAGPVEQLLKLSTCSVLGEFVNARPQPPANTLPTHCQHLANRTTLNIHHIVQDQGLNADAGENLTSVWATPPGPLDRPLQLGANGAKDAEEMTPESW